MLKVNLISNLIRRFGSQMHKVHLLPWGILWKVIFFFSDTVGINSSRVKQCSVLCDTDGLDSIYSSKKCFI